MAGGGLNLPCVWVESELMAGGGLNLPYVWVESELMAGGGLTKAGLRPGNDGNGIKPCTPLGRSLMTWELW